MVIATRTKNDQTSNSSTSPGLPVPTQVTANYIDYSPITTKRVRKTTKIQNEAEPPLASNAGMTPNLPPIIAPGISSAIQERNFDRISTNGGIAFGWWINHSSNRDITNSSIIFATTMLWGLLYMVYLFIMLQFRVLSIYNEANKKNE
jgi:hypothetical protein